MTNLIDFVLHIDKHLETIFTEYKALTYIILFIIIFAETGFVVTPFLPGDSLLFAAGALIAKIGVLNIWLLLGLLVMAAFLGNMSNYILGRNIGSRIFKTNAFFLTEANLQKTVDFYAKHGPKAVILSRFVPFFRTFVPFVSGVGKMDLSKYTWYTFIGGFTWISLFLLAGYFFGNIPIIKNNFKLVVIAILVVSVLPAVIEVFKSMKKKA